MKNEKVLKAKQINAISLLAMGTPASHVATKLEVSVMTIYRWQRLPQFEAKLNSITSSGLEEIAKKMNATSLTAVETLQEILCDLSEPAQMRMKAALGVLGVMSSVNGALEKSLHHRVADFDLQKRWIGQSATFDSSGNPIHELSPNGSVVMI